MAFGRDLPHGYQDALGRVRELLLRNPVIRERGTADSEAEQILVAAHFQSTGKKLSRIELFSRMGDRLPEDIAEKAIVIGTLRSEGRVLQHLTGYQQFLDHDYLTSPAALVPRPETEVLVELAMSELAKATPTLGFEIGVGTGIVSIELLFRFPQLRMVGSELKPEARKLAEENSKRILGTSSGRLELRAAEEGIQIFEPFNGLPKADFLISNPPYLSSDDEIDEEVRDQEPESALFAESPGNPSFFYSKIADEARKWLTGAGLVFLEIPHERSASIRALFTDRGWDAKIYQDLTGRDRVLIAKGT